MKYLTVEEFLSLTKLRKETVESLISLDIIKSVDKDGARLLDFESAKSFLGDKGQLENSTPSEAERNNPKSFIESEKLASLTEVSPQSTDEVQDMVGSVSDMIETEVVDQVNYQNRVISLLVERINALNQDRFWLKARIEEQQKQLNQAYSIIQEQTKIINQLTIAPKYPLLSRIFQALGLEREK